MAVILCGKQVCHLLRTTTRFITQGSYLKAKQKGAQKVKNVPEETVVQSVDPYECLKHDSCLGANIFKDGEDPILKDDSEYPVWLWSICDNTSINDDTSKLYWRQKNKKASRIRNRVMKLNN